MSKVVFQQNGITVTIQTPAPNFGFDVGVTSRVIGLVTVSEEAAKAQAIELVSIVESVVLGTVMQIMEIMGRNPHRILPLMLRLTETLRQNALRNIEDSGPE